MARLRTPEEILALASEAELVNPRIIARKTNSGGVALVLKHGPDNARNEIVFDRSADPAAARALMATAQAN